MHLRKRLNRRRRNKLSRKTPQNRQEVWFRYLPSSPDETVYYFDSKTGEVANRRHGSLRQPKQQDVIAEDSPLAKLLDEIRQLRADLLFQDDGLEATLTLSR
jgi:hypothetical protein